MLEAYDAAAIGSLDEEIRVAKAYLDWAVKQWSADPNGGITTTVRSVSKSGSGENAQQGYKSVTERLWVDIVREHGEHVRRLEQARKMLADVLPPPSASPAAPRSWSFGPAQEIGLDAPLGAPLDPGGGDAGD